MIRVVAADDHPIIIKFIEDELSNQADIELVGLTGIGSQIMKLVRTTIPNVVILDIGMDRGTFEPISVVTELKQEFPNTQVIILTGDTSAVYMMELTRAGALGYLLKSDDLSLNLLPAIRAVSKGKRYLSSEVMDTLLDDAVNFGNLRNNYTNQEIVVLQYLAKGFSNKQIADKMFVTEKRIRNILTDIYGKLGITEESNKRMAAVAKAREIGLLPD